MHSSPNPRLDAALAYAGDGLPVLPIWWPKNGRCACGKSECPSPAKHPIGALVPHGVKDATTDAGLITRWWTECPEANVAMVTGGASGRDVLDVDGEEGEASLATFEAQHGALPPTIELLTGGGGRHLHFKHRPGLRNAVKFLPGLDVRAVGGYVLVEPSVHVSGRPYVWETTHHPVDTALAPWPEALFALAAAPRRSRAPAASPDGGNPTLTPGGRNAGLASLAGTMRRRGMGEPSILAALLEENASRCKPPLAECEVKSIARSFARYPPTDDGARSRMRKPPKMFNRGDHVELGSALLKMLGHPDQLLVFDEGDACEYRVATGLWHVLEPARLSVDVQSLAGIVVAGLGPLKLRASDVAGAVKLAQARITRRGFFGDAAPGIAFTNGFLALGGDGALALVPHSPDHRARTSFPFAYEEGEDCPRFKALLADVFKPDADAEQKVLCVQEMGGAALAGLGPRFQRAFVLVGEGANGKSTLMEVVEGVMPLGTTSAVPPQEWSREYQLALLAGKRLNVVAELPDAKLATSEAFKHIVTGEPATARRIREAPFTFRPQALHMFSGNSLPQVRDLTHGFWRRIVLLRFNRIFEESEQVKGLAQQIVQSERAGLVAFFVEGVRRLQRQGGYTYVPSSALAREQWKGSADSVVHFVDSQTRPPRPGEKGMLSSALHAAYAAWAESEGCRALALAPFGARLSCIGVPSRRTEHGTMVEVRLREFGDRVVDPTAVAPAGAGMDSAVPGGAP